MLTIIIGIALIVFLWWIARNTYKSKEVLYGLCYTSVAILLLSLALGILIPISGFNDEWELIEETELIALSNAESFEEIRRVFVFISADNVYIYRHHINSNFGTETAKGYRTEILMNEEIEEVEDPNCETPVLRVYRKTTKRSIWTFALLGDEMTKYVFYVPEGSISKEVNHN